MRERARLRAPCRSFLHLCLLHPLGLALAGSPWGAGTFAGPMGARQPTDSEKALAGNQGKILAGVAKKLKA